MSQLIELLIARAKETGKLSARQEEDLRASLSAIDDPELSPASEYALRDVEESIMNKEFPSSGRVILTDDGDE